VPRTATVRTAAELGDVARPDQEGAAVIIAKVRESAPTAKPPLDGVFIKQRFMSALGNPESATSGTVL